MAKHGQGDRRLGVDRLGILGFEALAAKGIKVVEGESIAERARALKSVEELELMRASIRVAEEGSWAMWRALEPGITENALWAKLHEVNIRLGGEWIETRLLSAGPRTNPWFRECSMRPIERGEMVSFDTDLIGPYGYCADFSRAWICGGKPTADQGELHARALAQIQHNVAILKPGMTFREIVEASHVVPEEYAAHRYTVLMHGVGLADEWPSIKHREDFAEKGYDGVLLAGMTMCVESFVGREGGKEGVKLEDQVVITETGAERLNSFPLGLDPTA